MTLEREERNRQILEADRDALVWLANTGELASPVAHEINNFLNAILLHVAVLEMRVPEALRADLVEIRRQGKNMAAVVKQLQYYRRRYQPVASPCDLNQAVRDAVAELSRRPPEAAGGFSVPIALLSESAEEPPLDPLAIPVQLSLASGLPSVSGSPSDLKRLGAFLIGNAATAVAAAGGGGVTVLTETRDNQIVLQVADTAPADSLDQLASLFEPTAPGREGTNRLELAACKTLARRFHGTIQAGKGEEGGLSLIVHLPSPETLAAETHG